MIYHKKSEFFHRELLIIKKMINGKLRKSPTTIFYYNSADRRDLMSIRSVQKTGFFLNKQKPLFKPYCHGNSTHPCQNEIINTSVVDLDSCEKTGAKV